MRAVTINYEFILSRLIPRAIKRLGTRLGHQLLSGSAVISFPDPNPHVGKGLVTVS